MTPNPRPRIDNPFLRVNRAAEPAPTAPEPPAEAKPKTVKRKPARRT